MRPGRQRSPLPPLIGASPGRPASRPTTPGATAVPRTRPCAVPPTPECLHVGDVGRWERSGVSQRIGVGIAVAPGVPADASTAWQLDACRIADSRLTGRARYNRVLPSVGTSRELTPLSVYTRV